MTLSGPAWTQLISAAHTSGRKAALAITGGGTGAVGELLGVPGGSALLIEVQVPYSEQALESYLGFAPAQACSADTAIAMAHRARMRAAALGEQGANIVGLGATAALVSDRPRRGEHRFHVACECPRLYSVPVRKKWPECATASVMASIHSTISAFVSVASCMR